MALHCDARCLSPVQRTRSAHDAMHDSGRVHRKPNGNRGQATGRSRDQSQPDHLVAEQFRMNVLTHTVTS